MKKLISGVIAAFLLSAGFVAVSAETATAACRPGYTESCSQSTVKATPAPKVIKQGKAAKVKLNVKTRGNVPIKGFATVTVTGPGGFKKTIKKLITSSSATNVNLGKLKKPGKYKVKVVFKGDENVRDSSSSATITVKKKKR